MRAMSLLSPLGEEYQSYCTILVGVVTLRAASFLLHRK